jgi:hypothetical protein
MRIVAEGVQGLRHEVTVEFKAVREEIKETQAMSLLRSGS